MRSLPLFHRIAGKPVIVLGEGPAGEARQRLVERAGGVVAGENDAYARLAFIALDAPEEAAARLKARGVLVNVADRPELSDFTVPSLLERDPVLIAIGTSGASAGLAKQLRLRLEALLPASLGSLAEALNSARERLRAIIPDAAERRLALDNALAENGPLDPLAGRGEQDVADWLADTGQPSIGGHVVIVLTSDDPDELTLRQARLLGAADVLLVEPGVPAAILDRARADALRRELPFDGDLPQGLVVELRRS